MEILNDKSNDPLWILAKKRAAFKKHFAVYVIVNAFLWAIWYFTGQAYIWPVWVTLGWGVGVAFNYAGTYFFDHEDLEKREYENLKKEREGR